MDVDANKNKTPQEQKSGELGSAGATVESTLERGAEVYGQAKEAVNDVYAKTAQAVSETYEKAKSYSTENPGKAMLIGLGVGVGLGFLLGANTHQSRASRFARPVVNALSEIAREFFH